MKKTMKLKLMLIVATIALSVPITTYAWSGGCSRMWECATQNCFVINLASCVGGYIEGSLNSLEAI